MCAAGIINGLGHYTGYRNFDGPHAATNIMPLGILIGGEELHNHHHTFPTSARLSVRWFELDIGWGYIRLLRREPAYLSDAGKQVLAALGQRMRGELRQVWECQRASPQELLARLVDWCDRAEGSGIAVLRHFSQGLHAYG